MRIILWILGLIVIIGLVSMQVLADENKSENEAVKLLTSNEKSQILKGKERIKVYQTRPLSPIQFDVTGPGVLKLTFFKNATPGDKTAEAEATFSVLKKGVLIETVKVPGASEKKATYSEQKDYFPGDGETWSTEIPEETWNLAVMIAPDAIMGGAVGMEFSEPAPEEVEMVPLVPLVPLAPIAAVGGGEEGAAPAGKTAKAQEAQEPAKEEQVAEEVKEEEAPAVEGEGQVEESVATESSVDMGVWGNGHRYIMIETRFGLNIINQKFNVENGGSDKQINMMFIAGLSGRYIMPWLDERFRIGVGIDWFQYGFELNSPLGKHKYEIMSIPILLEFDAFILTEGLFRPFVGLGAGTAIVQMKYRGPFTKDLASDEAVFPTKATYAVAFWGGCQFFVWYGGPFIKARYLLSTRKYEDKGILFLERGEHGGFSLLTGYQFEF